MKYSWPSQFPVETSDRIAFEQPPLLLTVLFPRSTVFNFQIACGIGEKKKIVFFNLKKHNSGERVHGWSTHGFHSLQHNSRIKKLHGERWILNNYVDSVHRDMPSLAAEVLLLCFMWLLRSVEGALWAPQQAFKVFQGLFQYTTSPFPQEVLKGKQGWQEDAEDCKANSCMLTVWEFLVQSLRLFLALVK